MMLALGKHLLESTAFAAFIGVLVFALRRGTAATRHTLWLFAAAKFVLPVAIFSLLGSKLAGLLPADSVSGVAPLSLIQWVAPSPASRLAPTTSTAAFDLLLLVWLLGCAVMFITWLPRLCSSPSFSESCEGLSQESVDRLKRRMGLRQTVTLRSSDSISGPLLFGFFRPVVILPVGLSGKLSSPELDSVILHELAHARRKDNWMAAFAHAVTCLFWFYPLPWWIERRLRREREFACDEMVVRCGAVPDDYLAGILKVCRFQLHDGVAGVSGVCGTNLKNRMEAIMSVSSQGSPSPAPKTLLGGLLAAVILVPLLIGFFIPTGTYGQAAKPGTLRGDQQKSASPHACDFASVAYPEGTVIQQGSGPEQMCAQVLMPADPRNPGAAPKYHAEWLYTSDAIRARSATVIHVPVPPPFWCTPKPSSEGNACVCDQGVHFSPGSLVNSAIGPLQLRCDKGSWVQTATPNVVRK